MCTRPYSVRTGKGPFSVQKVPCGKCCECKKQYQNDWMCRMVEEFRSSPTACFFTLTYNEDNVPYLVDVTTGEAHRTVYKKHVQDWLKRFRTSESRKGLSTNWRYYITSEYGPRTARPHMHGLIWLPRARFQFALLDWQQNFGFTNCSEIHLTDPDGIFKIARYVSKYCSKGVFENPKVESGEVAPTFHLSSKGLGLTYADRMRDYHLCNDHKLLFKRTERNLIYTDFYLEEVTRRMRVNMLGSSVSYHMPRYWKEKIFSKRIITENGKIHYQPNQVWLQAQLQTYISRRTYELYCDKRKLIQSQHPNWSEAETSCFMVLQESSELEQREKDARTSLGRFYDKSKI